jgi:peptidoglycan/LPS O-acetylase OafA/YrhL
VTAFWQRLTRVTSSGRFIPELDGLRAVAITAVFLQHLHQVVIAHGDSSSPDSLAVRLFFRDATYGVELFFVISGFILALPFASHFINAGDRVKLGEYYKRRLTRLEPPYVLHLLLLAVVFILSNHPVTEVLKHFLASLFYVSNIAYGQFHAQSLNSVTWSLEIEVQFYLLAPLFSQVFRLHRRFREAFIVLAVLLIFWVRQGLERHYGPLPVTLLNYFPYFAVGYLLANRYAQDWHESSPTRTSSDLIAVVAAAALLALFQFAVPAMTLVLAFVLYVAVSSCLQSRRIKLILSSRLVRTVGGMCYSIYLLHLPLLHWLVPLIPLRLDGHSFLGMLLAAIVYGIPVLIVSGLFFAFVERPCMQRNWWHGIADQLKVIGRGTFPHRPSRLK